MEGKVKEKEKNETIGQKQEKKKKINRWCRENRKRGGEMR